MDDLARRVINGEFGNGEARKVAFGTRLTFTRPDPFAETSPATASNERWAGMPERDRRACEYLLGKASRGAHDHARQKCDDGTAVLGA